MKMLLLLLFPAFLLACTFTLPITRLNGTPTPPAPTRTPLGLGLTEVRLYPRGGDLLAQLQDQAPKATALGQHMFVEFDASWCPACKKIAAGLADENLLLLANFDGVYLVHLDVDEWGWRNVAPGFSVAVIPTYFRLDALGKPTGDKLDAGAWKKDTYEDITRVLGPWFHQP